MTGKVPAFSTCREEQTGAAGNVGNGAARSSPGQAAWVGGQAQEN